MDRRSFLKLGGITGLGAVVLGPSVAFSNGNITDQFLKRLRGNEWVFDRPEASGYEAWRDNGRTQYWTPFRAYEWSHDPKVIKNDPLVLTTQRQDGALVEEVFEDTNLDGRVDVYFKGNFFDYKSESGTRHASAQNVTQLPEYMRRQFQQKYELGLRELIKEIDVKLASYAKKSSPKK